MSNDGSQIRCQAFFEPKRGHGREEYEDAFAGNVARGRFAVADGATESAYAALWARMLVEEFVSTSSTEPTAWATWLPEVQTRWEAAVGHQPLPWYAEIKWQQGAFATFVGVVMQPPRWQALAVGDSCLFHTRDGQLRSAFPVASSHDFANSPWLVGSRGFTPDMMAVRELRSEGDFGDGDRLWLMTDALAHWFLQSAEAGDKPWECLEPFLALPDAAVHFHSWIAEMRDTHRMRNDDVTLLAIWSA